MLTRRKFGLLAALSPLAGLLGIKVGKPVFGIPHMPPLAKKLEPTHVDWVTKSEYVREHVEVIRVRVVNVIPGKGWNEPPIIFYKVIKDGQS